MSPQKCGVGTQITKIQRQCRAPGGHGRRRLRSLWQSSLNRARLRLRWLLQKIMDVIAKQTDCDGQAADAVSAYTQVKLEDAPRLLNIPNSECPDVLDTYSTTFSSEIYTNIHSLDCCGTGNSRKLYWKLDGDKVPNWECFFVHRKQGLISWVYVDDIKMAGKKQNNDSHVEENGWNMLILTNQFHFLITFFFLGCTQRECKPNEVSIEQFQEMLESRISVEATEKLPGWEKPHAKTVACPTTWKDMLKHASRNLRRLVEQKDRAACTQLQRLCLDDHHFKKEELGNSLRYYQKYARKLSW